MQVRVLFFGVLKDIVGCAEETLEVAPQSTVGSVYESFSRRFETLRDKRPSILFARNREFSSAEAVLSEDDEIAFLPPVSGGSAKPLEIEDADGHFFAIVRLPIESRKLVERVQRPEDGAVIVFEGVVRNNTRHRQTEYLEYECYEQMALEGMARIGREIAAGFAVGRIGIVHRLGRLQVGEASVVIAVAASHRGAAFDAARQAIDRLKREVPIWKKEFFADGAVWVDGEWDERLLAGTVAPHGS
jgi:molybdopterin converting factor subunit 1